ncbi:phosphonopyruvate decarboxylase [Helicobacter sp. 23-1044]
MNANEFYQSLVAHGVELFCGVPDSLLKDFCACVSQSVSDKNHIITANEGNALALAAGHYLATNKIAVVYMQNSGLGNIVNPLLSLMDSEVYNIPALLLIGWRGEPNVKDEPQHETQGKLTLPLLETMGIKYEILQDLTQIGGAFKYMNGTNKPFAFVVKKGTFESYKKVDFANNFSLPREKAIKKVISLMRSDDIVVSTTGMISRELYENRKTHEKDFLVVGSMGHASSIAFGIALNKPNRRIFCFDGDGALLMHLGALPVIASKKLPNFKHIVFNNEAHDSVGGQRTAMDSVNLAQIAKGCGYEFFKAQNLNEIENIWDTFAQSHAPSMLEICVKKGNRKDLGRPKENPKENKMAFMKFVKES